MGPPRAVRLAPPTPIDSRVPTPSANVCLSTADPCPLSARLAQSIGSAGSVLPPPLKQGLRRRRRRGSAEAARRRGDHGMEGGADETRQRFRHFLEIPTRWAD